MKSQRLLSLDAFRGLTIATMILVNTPGSWAHLYPLLKHASWHGCTLTDLVFPFFLFIVGVALRFSLKKFDFRPSAALQRKILGRTVTIFILGLLLNAYPFIRQDWDWSTFRIMGVLQRIALAYGFAAILVLRLNLKQLWSLVFTILAAYWILLWALGGSDPYGLEGNLVRRIDLSLVGAAHLWQGNGIPFDPEGLLSTLPALVTVLIGYLVGIMIQTADEQQENVIRMALLGALLIIAGWIWGLVFPINKPLWTSSYVLFTAGIATLILSALVWLVEVKGYRKSVWPLVVYGTNSIFVFVASGLWVKTLLKIKFTLADRNVSGYAYLYRTVFQPLGGDLNGSLLFALAHVLGWWLILYWLDRKNVHIKI